MIEAGRRDHDVASAAAVPPGGKMIVDVAGRSIGVFNVDGTLHAVLNRCPHALAPLCLANLTGTWLAGPPDAPEYGLEGRVLRCIWHGWEWNIETGRTVVGTDPRRLSKYPVHVDDGRVIVSIPERRPPAADEVDEQRMAAGLTSAYAASSYVQSARGWRQVPRHSPAAKLRELLAQPGLLADLLEGQHWLRYIERRGPGRQTAPRQPRRGGREEDGLRL